jgi:outer membrane protein assembly factor BamB
MIGPRGQRNCSARVPRPYGGSRMPINLRQIPACAGLAIIAVCVLAAGAALAAPIPARGKVVAVDKRTGRAAWEAPLWSRPDAAVPPLVTAERIYVLQEGRVLKSLDAATGKPCWQTPAVTTLPLAMADDLVVAVTGDTARAFDRWNGKQKWEFRLRFFPEWKFDAKTIPVGAPGRVLLPAGSTLIAVDTASGQPAWAYTATAAKLPLQPVVVGDMVYLRTQGTAEESEVRLKLDDGLPDSGEYTLPRNIARAIERERKAQRKATPVTPPAAGGKKTPFVAVRAQIASGGKALAAAGAKRWSFPAPSGWTIDRVAGESASHVYALLGAAAPAAPRNPSR